MPIDSVQIEDTLGNRVAVVMNKGEVAFLPSGKMLLNTYPGPCAPGAYNDDPAVFAGTTVAVGFKGYDGLALGSLDTIECTWAERVTGTDVSYAQKIYAMLVVDTQAAPGVKLSQLSSSVPAASDDNWTRTDLGGGRWRYSWARATNTVLVVDKIDPVVPTFTEGSGWWDNAYTVADILATYPSCQLADASTGSVLLAKDVVTPSVMLMTGDPNNVKASQRIIESVKVNGTAV